MIGPLKHSVPWRAMFYLIPQALHGVGDKPCFALPFDGVASFIYGRLDAVT